MIAFDFISVLLRIVVIVAKLHAAAAPSL